MKLAFNATRETLVLTFMLLAVAGCDRRPADLPTPTTSTPGSATGTTSVPAPMPPASAASQ